jgi:hypothetical protein
MDHFRENKREVIRRFRSLTFELVLRNASQLLSLYNGREFFLLFSFSSSHALYENHCHGIEQNDNHRDTLFRCRLDWTIQRSELIRKDDQAISVAPFFYSSTQKFWRAGISSGDFRLWREWYR